MDQLEILQHMGIDIWRMKCKQSLAPSQNAEAVSLKKRYHIHVFLTDEAAKKKIMPMLSALFFVSEMSFYPKMSLPLERTFTSDDIILYDNRLSLAKKTMYQYPIEVDRLTEAKIKKKVMMRVYGISDFAVKRT